MKSETELAEIEERVLRGLTPDQFRRGCERMMRAIEQQRETEYYNAFRRKIGAMDEEELPERFDGMS